MIQTQAHHEVYKWTTFFKRAREKGMSIGDASRKANRLLLKKRKKLLNVLEKGAKQRIKGMT